MKRCYFSWVEWLVDCLCSCRQDSADYFFKKGKEKEHEGGKEEWADLGISMVNFFFQKLGMVVDTLIRFLRRQRQVDL